jgi:hypothetical protein
MVLAELSWPLVGRNLSLGLVAELAAGWGTAGRFDGEDVDVRALQVLGLGGLRLRARVTRRLAFEATVAGGIASVSSTYPRMTGMQVRERTVNDAALALSLGAAAIYDLPHGELIVDARWAHATYEQSAQIEGNAVGVVLSAGWRVTF